MKTSECFECGQPAGHDHHVVPKSLGGTRTVPLCSACHSKIHGLKSMATSELIKKAIATYRKNGGLVGAERPECRNLSPSASRKGVERAAKLHVVRADEHALSMKESLLSLRASGLSDTAIAEHLNLLGVPTRRGKTWHQSQVSNLFKRISRLSV